MTAEFGRQWVQASAYGDEERFPLRFPVGAGLAAIVAWVVWAPTLIAGPLLLAAESWIVGVVLTLLALAGVVVLGPRWHRLSLRWFVLVPAGVVVHDPVVLADTFPLRTAQVASIGLAPADTQGSRPDRPGQRLRRRDRDHRVGDRGLRVHAVRTERQGDPPAFVPDRPEPPRPSTSGQPERSRPTALRTHLTRRDVSGRCRRRGPGCWSGRRRRRSGRERCGVAARPSARRSKRRRSR